MLVILSLFTNLFNIIKNTGARILDLIYQTITNSFKTVFLSELLKYGNFEGDIIMDIIT